MEKFMSNKNIMAKDKKPAKITLANYTDQFVKVYPTKSNRFHHPSKSVMMHPDAAKTLVKRGLMTSEAPEGWEEFIEEGEDENNDEE